MWCSRQCLTGLRTEQNNELGLEGTTARHRRIATRSVPLSAGLLRRAEESGVRAQATPPGPDPRLKTCRRHNAAASRPPTTPLESTLAASACPHRPWKPQPVRHLEGHRPSRLRRRQPYRPPSIPRRTCPRRPSISPSRSPGSKATASPANRRAARGRRP